MHNAELDPFRVILSVVAGHKDSDLLIEVASAAGLRFDTSVSGDPAYSTHKARVRDLLPRIWAAYDSLSEPASLGAANALCAPLRSRGILDEAADALRRVGWDIRDAELVSVDPDLREMFFPKGSRWDAYVVLRDLFGEASTELVVVDAYCDGIVFELLAARSSRPLTVRILCWKAASAVVGEAKAFVAQFPGWVMQVHQGKDFHDRFLTMDGTSCIHLGASINGAGKTAFMISRIEDQANRDALLAQIQHSWSAATPLM